MPDHTLRALSLLPLAPDADQLVCERCDGPLNTTAQRRRGLCGLCVVDTADDHPGVPEPWERDAAR